MTTVFAEVYMHCKLFTKQPVLHTYSLLRTSHRNDLGVTLWMYGACICDHKDNEKLYRNCGGKLYKLIGLCPFVFLITWRLDGPFFSANNLLSQHNTSLTVRDITTCNILILWMTVTRYLLNCYCEKPKRVHVTVLIWDLSQSSPKKFQIKTLRQ